MRTEHTDTKLSETRQSQRWWIFVCATAIIGLSALLHWALFLVVLVITMLSVARLFKTPQSDPANAQAAFESEEAHKIEAHKSQLLNSVFDSADIPMLGTDAQGRLSLINQRAVEVMKILPSLVGRSFDEVFPQRALWELESLARDHEAGHAKFTIAIDGEIREFDVSADPIPFSGGAVLTFRDITELSRAMTLKADFVANASHELRTPIASIKGAVETLAGPAQNDPRMSARLIEMITSNATRLEMLASDLLDLSKLESEDQPPQITEVVLADFIAHIIAAFKLSCERKSLQVVTEIEDGLTLLSTDPTLLALILRNLLSNAIKFAHEGTAVRVTVERAQVAADRTAPAPAELNHPMGVKLSVIDQGIGIPLAQQQRVFERFYQVDDARTGSVAKRGTGLGLAIVKHAARRLGGSVMLESVYQSGTTVSVELPRCTD